MTQFPVPARTNYAQTGYPVSRPPGTEPCDCHERIVELHKDVWHWRVDRANGKRSSSCRPLPNHSSVRAGLCNMLAAAAVGRQLFLGGPDGHLASCPNHREPGAAR